MPREAPVTSATLSFRSGVMIMMRSLAPVGAGEPLGLGDVLDGVGIEKGIDRGDRPGHGGERIPRGPAVDLADVLLYQRVAQIVAQGDAPQSDQRMDLFVVW